MGERCSSFILVTTKKGILQKQYYSEKNFLWLEEVNS